MEPKTFEISAAVIEAIRVETEQALAPTARNMDIIRTPPHLRKLFWESVARAAQHRASAAAEEAKDA